MNPPRDCDERCDELDFTPSDSFASVLGAEYAEIQQRRVNDPDGVYQDGDGRPRALSGIALSGGGIRSATFNLGLLQTLAQRGLLKRFDYLSTVSGGGYCGGWWSAWLSRPTRQPGEFFPPAERIELERHDVLQRDEEATRDAGHDVQVLSDSAMNAGVDPIHHLRLFSNFLTPRKGLLSGDTWRAVTVIGRNLLLTWMILIPILLGAIMCGQAYFCLTTGHEFDWRNDLDREIDTAADDGTVAKPVQGYGDDQPEFVADRRHVLKHRLLVAFAPPALLFLGVIFCIIVWMIANRRCWHLRDVIVVTLSIIAFGWLTWLVLKVTERGPTTQQWLIIFCVFAVYAIVMAAGAWQRIRRRDVGMGENDYWRNQIVAFQTKLLTWTFLSAAVLLFAGFGHEVLDFLLYNTRFHTFFGDQVARAGGWSAIALTVIGSIYTATKGAPRGGDDTTQQARPGLVDRFIFAVIPPALLLVLALFLAFAGHRLYTTVYDDRHGEIWFVTIGTVLSAFLFLSFALYEFRPPARWKSLILLTVWLAIALGVYLIPTKVVERNLVSVAGGLAIFNALAIAGRGPRGRRNWGWIAVSGAAGAIGWFLIHRSRLEMEFTPLPVSALPQAILIGLFFSLTLLLFELKWGEGSNLRSFALMMIGFAMFALTAVGACAPDDVAWRALAVFGCISLIAGWVVALGWLADPNTLTIHGFYKSRLVRAYMGASNDARRVAREANITDAVPGDDVPLQHLANTRQGAPYHLVNTTLNLVGAQDLATVQRFSDEFVMSKHYCGSLRTGYRPTREYACGTISLGTAVAISGAAASPNMGGQTPSAALAVLMTLFNVRLGYWAPTPNRGYWRSGSARLWPVYTLQELMSQTTDLMPYCYLTDGGHFDNTGVYSLVQRGCRYILYSDCGADPAPPKFADLGDLIRKVRIDFGTEIDIDIERLRESADHYVAGTIRYGAAHAKAIGLADDERTGVLIVVKPNLAPSGLSVDVRQYGFANDAFPQQTTADQWYDEQQFESYRRLGAISAALLMQDKAEVPDLPGFFEARSGVSSAV